jgi:hypothetical protein
MGYVTSTPKVTLDAFLTQKGRNYLVQLEDQDKYNIFYFGLGDPDCNYVISSIDKIGEVKNVLPSGFVVSLSGDHNCIKSLAIEKQRFILFDDNKDNDNNFENFNNI